jgi:hypothetical protein
MAIYLVASHKKGISSHQLAKDIDVTQKTAWFMLHRIRYAFEHPNFQKTMGENAEIEKKEDDIAVIKILEVSSVEEEFRVKAYVAKNSYSDLKSLLVLL